MFSWCAGQADRAERAHLASIAADRFGRGRGAGRGNRKLRVKSCKFRWKNVFGVDPTRRAVEDPGKLLQCVGFLVRFGGMIRDGFLTAKERAELSAQRQFVGAAAMREF